MLLLHYISEWCTVLYLQQRQEFYFALMPRKRIFADPTITVFLCLMQCGPAGRYTCVPNLWLLTVMSVRAEYAFCASVWHIYTRVAVTFLQLLPQLKIFWRWKTGCWIYTDYNILRNYDCYKVLIFLLPAHVTIDSLRRLGQGVPVASVKEEFRTVFPGLASTLVANI